MSNTPLNKTPGLIVRRAAERGHFNHGWLDTWHSFSFADYHDPRFMGFRTLRVINEDFVAPGRGFPTHPHRDMEIVTFAISGAVAHRDNMGNGSTIRPGEIQKMTAGRGVQHSEANPLPDEPLHLLQIWMLPSALGLTPGYEQHAYDDAARENALLILGSPGGADGGVKFNTDARLFTARLAPEKSLAHTFPLGRQGWIQIVRGAISVDGVRLGPSDGAALIDPRSVTLIGIEQAELLLFDLP